MSEPTFPPAGETRLSREIERKFLLRGLPPRALEHDPSELAQGYVPGTNIHERVRRARRGDRVTLTRTIKLGRGVERIEVEETVEQALFDGLYALTQGARVEKLRYRVPEGARTWEIDAFTDRELHLAELELESADEPITFPDWLAPYVVREVTDDPAYLNLNLAR